MTPHPTSPVPSAAPATLLQLAPRAGGALLLALLGGHTLALDDGGPWLGLALAVAALAVLLHTLWSWQQRVQAVIAQSAAALRQLSQGGNAFRLDAHGLAEFDPLLLAIDDLREAVEPFSAAGAASNARAIDITRPVFDALHAHRA